MKPCGAKPRTALLQIVPAAPAGSFAAESIEKLVGQHSELGMEALGEIGGRSKSHHIADFRHAQIIGFRKELGGCFQPRRTQKFVGRGARQRLNARKEKRTAHADGRSDVLDRQARIGNIIHNILVDLHHKTVASRHLFLLVEEGIGHFRKTSIYFNVPN